MRILFLTRSFNSLAQRLYLELTGLGHEVAIEFDISEAVTIEAVALYRPDLIVAPFLQRAIPAEVWQHTVCLVVHPGVVGDRGPSSLDWALQDGETRWGVTVLQAVAEMDAGPVWASETFAMRLAPKSSLYRQEVTEAAAAAVLRAVKHFEQHGGQPPVPAPAPDPRGRWRPLMRQPERRIDWQHDDTIAVLRKAHAADGTPGVLDELFGVPCHLFDLHAQALPQTNHPAGTLIARRDEAVLRATRDGAVWIGHVRRAGDAAAIKLPVALAFADEFAALRPWTAADEAAAPGWHELRTEVVGDVACVHFDFHNGAMSTAQCRRLIAAVSAVLAGPQKVLLLCGGRDFWSNGIHLNVIEAAASPAEASWENISAIDDLARLLIEATGHVVIAALQGNAGAGGAFLALAADQVWARPGVVLNPHYKNMGNLYGSEYWTYLLPHRLKGASVADVMGRRLPLSARRAMEMGLVDEVFGGTADSFMAEALARAATWAARPDLAAWLQAKQARRAQDEAHKPLQAYRDEELARMQRNFFGFDPSYHIARSNFVRRVLPSWTPRHLAIHR